MDKKLLPIMLLTGGVSIYLLLKSDMFKNLAFATDVPDYKTSNQFTWYINQKALDLLSSSEKNLVIKAWERAKPYMMYIEEYGRKYNVYVPLILSIIMVESAFNPNAKKYERSVDQYSLGLMQILPSTAKTVGFYGNTYSLIEPKHNIEYGTKYLAYQLNRYNRSLEKTAAAYNAGSAIYNEKGEFINQVYVNNVLRNYTLFNTALTKR